MAKSLRAKGIQKTKTLKRKSVFGEAHEKRVQRLAEKLHEAGKQLVKETKTAAPEEEMQVEPKKVSTAGWGKKKSTKKRSKKSRNKR